MTTVPIPRIPSLLTTAKTTTGLRALRAIADEGSLLTPSCTAVPSTTARSTMQASWRTKRKRGGARRV